MNKLRTTIDSDRQAYVDEPVFVLVARAQPLALEINRVFARTKVRGPRMPASIRELDHYSRVPLRWMTPDGKGGLVPKYPRQGSASR